MADIDETLTSFDGTFDVFIDPSVGLMELKEIGVADRLEYNLGDRFAYALEMKPGDLKELLADIKAALGIRDNESEVYDHISETTTKTIVEPAPLDEENSFWVTFWYDSGVGKIHHQAKLELFFKPHSQEIPDRLDFLETKKKLWVNKIAEDCQKEFDDELDFHDFNRYIKKNGMLWLLEEVMGLGYDVYDMLDDINKKLRKRK